MSSLYNEVCKMLLGKSFEDEMDAGPGRGYVYVCRPDAEVMRNQDKRVRVHSQSLCDYFTVVRGVCCPYCSAGYKMEKETGRDMMRPDKITQAIYDARDEDADAIIRVCVKKRRGV